MPQQILPGDGSFTLTSNIEIFYDTRNRPEIQAIAEYLAEKINRATGFDLKSTIFLESEKSASTILLTTQGTKQDLGNEGYELEVQENSITLRAKTPAGIFYGVQTIRQLLPPEIESSS